MFSIFWNIIFEQKVSIFDHNMLSIFLIIHCIMQVEVIVMITGLVEGMHITNWQCLTCLSFFWKGNKVKANQYWPDMDNPCLQLEGGFKA